MRINRVAVGFLWMVCLTVWAEAPTNFDKAKRLAMTVFSRYQVTLYCGCRYDEDKKVDLHSCQMHQATPIARANRLEWEHMMPASQFGQSFQCWREKICFNEKKNQYYRGRKCCQKVSPEFRRIEAELYNLWPAVGLVNQIRSNYLYSELVNKRGLYGCLFDVIKEKRLAEPPDIAKGVVARANLFMSWKYGVTLAPSYQKLLKRWNQQYPPLKKERDWANHVADIDEYVNPFIHYYKDNKALNKYLATHGGSKSSHRNL